MKTNKKTNKKIIMKLIPITPRSRRFVEYEPTLGLKTFTTRITGRIRRLRHIERRVRCGEGNMVVALGDENLTAEDKDPTGIFLWENDTPRRVSAARRSGQLIEP